MKRAGRNKPAAGDRAANKNYERCDLCGAPEKAPVARMIRGNLKWICGNCWKEMG